MKFYLPQTHTERHRLFRLMGSPFHARLHVAGQFSHRLFFASEGLFAPITQVPEFLVQQQENREIRETCPPVPGDGRRARGGRVRAKKMKSVDKLQKIHEAQFGQVIVCG
jgi:hypothetical protein